MGASFDSIHVRTEDSRSVQKALEQIAKEADCKFLLGPALNGWTSIFPSDSGKGDEICAKIAKLAYNNRGMVKRVKGDLDGALEDYNKAISLKPDFSEAISNRDKAKIIKNSKKF